MRALWEKLSKDRAQLNYVLLVAMTLGLVVFGWVNVYWQYQDLRQAGIRSMELATREVVRSIALAAKVYADQQLNKLNRPLSDVPTIEQEIWTKFAAPVNLLDDKQGDAWIIGANKTMVFDNSVDFTYRGVTIDKFLPLQAQAAGAQDYEQMLNDVLHNREGVGSYIWDRVKGIEVGAWTPVDVTGDGKIQWMIGATVPLTTIMEQTGANAAVQKSSVVMAVLTLVVGLILVIMYFGLRQVHELQERVVGLQIQVDEAKKARQVQDIVESEYFQRIRAQGKQLRARARGEADGAPGPADPAAPPLQPTESPLAEHAGKG